MEVQNTFVDNPCYGLVMYGNQSNSIELKGYWINMTNKGNDKTY